MSTKVQCPAKVNFFLEVTGRRRDGYHTLATLFAKINLFDELELESMPEAGPIEFVVESGQVPTGSDNLVYRAAEAFRKAFHVRAGVRIRLRKVIPVGAGLGGGSSDAAGTLLGLQRLFGDKGAALTAFAALSVGRRRRLKELAVSLGADVPFFLRQEPYCVGRGIGERLTALKVAKAPPWMVLVYPGEAISTAGVYRTLGKHSLTRLAQLGKLKKKLGNGRPISEWEGFLFNRLEEVVLSAHPEVAQVKRILSQLGARGALMSGSGSSVFGFVSSHEEGERLRMKLQAYPWRVYVTCCIG